MKKTILLIASLMFVFASASFAADITSDGTSIGQQSYKPSNNVTVRVVSDIAAYAVESGHTKGNRTYGSSSVETKIFYKDVTGSITTDHNPVTAMDVSATTHDFGGWSSL